MVGIKHATKKRFAKAKTSKRTIKTGISAEYTDYKSKLDAVVTAIKSLIKQIQTTPQVWAGIARHQMAFASVLLAALASDGLVRSHAREVEGTVRQLQRLILEDEGAAAPHRRITAVLDAYLKSVENVQADYNVVETSFTEVVRYQKKVDKLNNKKHPEKKKEILSRNVDKLAAARTEHDHKLEAIIERMKATYEKHEAVFQCAHHAFWLAQEQYSSVINDTTKSIRWESMAVREHLMKIDVTNSPRLPPIPRVQMLLPAMAATEISSVPIEPVIARPQSAIVVMPQTPHTSVHNFSKETSPSAVTPVQYVSPATPQQVSVSGANTSPVRHSPKVVYTTEGIPIQQASIPMHKSPESNGTNAQHPVVHLTPETPAVHVALPPRAQEVVQTVPQHTSGQGDVIYIPAPPTEMPTNPTRLSTQQSSSGVEPAFVGA